MGIKIKKDDITKVKDISDFDEAVYIRRLSVRECAGGKEDDNATDLGRLIMARALVNAQGERFYKDNEVDQMLADIPIRAMKSLSDQVNAVNGVNEKKPKAKSGDSSTD